MKKIYRSKIPIIGGMIGSLAFFLIGLGGLLPGSNAGVSGILVGGLCLIFATLLSASAATNRLIITSDGIVSWHTLRKKGIPWSSVRSLEVSEPRGLLPWPALVINSASGRIRIDSIVGRRSFVEKVADDLDLFRRDKIASGVLPNSKLM
jgi:hypothetical protein